MVGQRLMHVESRSSGGRDCGFIAWWWWAAIRSLFICTKEL